MRKNILIIAVIAAVMLMGSAAHAALTNYVTNPGFESSSSWASSSTYQGNSYWYENGNWSRSNSYHYSGSYSAALGSYSSGTFFQILNMPNQGLHTFTLSFWTQYVLSSSSTSSLLVYGFTDKPANGASPTSGTQIGTTQYFQGSQSSWIQKTFTYTPTANYSWFSIVFYGTTGSSSGRYFRVDDVSVVPIPPAALLLASGLLGLVGLRRFRKKIE